MAYIFHEDDLPRLVSRTPGRERVFFANKELADQANMLAGVMHYAEGAASPYHFHENCEHFYFIIDGLATVETEEGKRDIAPGDLVFFPPEARHRLSSRDGPLFYFEFQAPNRFKTTILDGTPDDLLWDRRDGGVWAQS